MSKKLYQDAEWLRERYWDEGLTLAQMGELADCSPTTIRKWMKRYEVPCRHRGGASVGVRAFYCDKEWLQQKYWNEELALSRMGELAECSGHTIGRWMDKYGIPRRSSDEEQSRKYKDQICRNETWLREQYCEKGLNNTQVAELAGCHPITVAKWLDKYDIPRHTASEVVLARKPQGNETYRNKEWLQQKYWKEEMLISEMAQLVDRSTSTICHWMEEYGIPSRRNINEPYKNAGWLKEQYWEKGLNTIQMAELAECTENAINYWMHKHNILTHRTTEKLCWSKEWLQEQHWEQELSIPQMAKIANVASTTVRRRMIKHDIPIRDQAETMKLVWARGAFDSEETRQKRSKATKEAHARGDLAGNSEAMKAAWARGVYDGVFDSEETRQKKSKATKTAWACGTHDGHFTEEVRQKLSEGMRAAWADGRVGNEEWRRMHSEALKARWANGEMGGEEWLRSHSKAAKIRWETGVYDNVFQSPTSIEIETTDALDILGIAHQAQYRPDGYSRVFDEFVPPNILIEVQGDYWHTKDGMAERDAEKAAWAKENGYHLVAIWEHEIKEQGALALIQGQILSLLNIQRSKNKWLGL